MALPVLFVRPDADTINRPIEATDLAFASGSIVSGSLAPSIVFSGHIASGAIGSIHLADDAVQSGDVAAAAISSGHITSGTIGSVHLADAAVQSGDVAAAAISSGHIASGTVGSIHLADNAVQSGDVAINAISSGHIASGVIGSVHLADAAVQSGDIGIAAVSSGNIASGLVHKEALYIFRADGRYRIASGGIDITEPSRAFAIRNVVMRREVAGTAGSTDCDILMNGTTIFTTPANRPVTYAASGNQTRVMTTPDVANILSGARIEMAILTAETGAPQDIVIELIPL